MTIPPCAALHILESEQSICDEEGSTCSTPDHESQGAMIDDYSTGDYVVLLHDMYCHNCNQNWTNAIEYQAS